MHQETPPSKVASNDQLGHANEAQPLVDRLRDRAHNGIAPMHELARIDMLAAAAEIDRLRAALSKANAQAERFERGWYLRGDALQAVADAEAADTLGIEAALLGTVKAALRPNA